MHLFSPRALVMGAAAIGLALSYASSSRADLIHRYSFDDGTVNDSIGGANGTLVNNTLAAPPPTVSGGQLQFNNPAFTGTSTQRNYLSLPPSILPSNGKPRPLRNGLLSVDRDFLPRATRLPTTPMTRIRRGRPTANTLCTRSPRRSRRVLLAVRTPAARISRRRSMAFRLARKPTLTERLPISTRGRRRISR